MKALAFDIGGTKIFYAVVDKTGKILSEITKISTPKTIEDFKSIFKNTIEKYENEVDAIAISTAGAVNNENTGIIGSTNNIVEGYSTINFQSLSKKKVFVENDANCAAWAEYAIGAAKGCPNNVMLTFGTGVGGGIIVNGKLLKGKNGAAGEMHFKLHPDRHRPCTCGSQDCYECYASGLGLKKTAEEILNNPNVTTYDVIDGVKAKDETFLKIFNAWQNDILLGIQGIANIFDPECIVLSGSMAQFLDEKYLEEKTNADIVTTPTKIVQATSGNYAGMIGAALLALGV